MSRSFSWEMVIRGHHIYKAIWTPVINEILSLSQEHEDPFAVSVIKDGDIVGHVPREVSRIVWHFIEHDGIVDCQVSGRRKHGKGLEVPCIYCFRGKSMIRKLRTSLSQVARKMHL